MRPDVSYVRPTPILVAPWARSGGERAAYAATDRMAACVIRGGIRPKVDGDYTFILPKNGATLLTRNMEALREGARRWRVALAEAREGGSSGK